MSAKLANVYFDQEDRFDLAPRLNRNEFNARFAQLKNSLLGELLEQTETVSLRPRFERAANEAAGLAFTTEFPLLVFPELFEELARRERARETRQQRIMAKSHCLFEAV